MANGPLHVGHLLGLYLAADIAARAARARGERVVVTTGLDVHQNYVLTRAEREGVDVGAMTADFRDDIQDTYGLARIGYDYFTDPLGDGHTPIIRQLMNHLVTSGAAPLREVTLHACADCGRTLHESYLSGLCGECKAPRRRWRLRAMRQLHPGRHHGRSGLRPLWRRATSVPRRQCRYCGWRTTARP